MFDAVAVVHAIISKGTVPHFVFETLSCLSSVSSSISLRDFPKCKTI